MSDLITNPIEERCGTCRFFQARAESPFSEDDGGRCRVDSPGEEGWPLVRAGGWCGKWELADEFARPFDVGDYVL